MHVERKLGIHLTVYWRALKIPLFKVTDRPTGTIHGIGNYTTKLLLISFVNLLDIPE